MGFACNLLGHKWNHCRCERCGETKGLDQRELAYHDWNGCTCRVCGQVQRTGHDWDGCTCRICGEKRDMEHRIKNGVCVICGKRVTKEELLQAFKGYSSTRRISPRELEEHHPAAQLAMAYEALPPGDADEVLVKAYLALIDAYGREMGAHPRIDDKMRELIVPYATAANLPLLYQANKLHIHRVSRHLDKELVLQVCRESFSDDKLKIDFLKRCKVADGLLVKPCDVGQHDYHFDRYWESGFSGTSDSTEASYEYAIYRCSICGHEEKRPTGSRRI